MGRESDIDRLYALLQRLENNVGGKRVLKECDGYMEWPDRGIYFFFSPDETRKNGKQLRLTRIGTHAVSRGSQTSLWNRLRTHRGATRGTYEGGGNHRGSVFRKRIGEAIIERDGHHDEYTEWGVGSTADRELRISEIEMERQVSEYIRELPFLWLELDDEPGPDSNRAYVEQNSIALVSNFDSPTVDPRSSNWLGKYSPVDEIRESGLWNINHVSEAYDSDFLDFLEQLIDRTGSSTLTSNAAGSGPNPDPGPEKNSTEASGSFDEVWDQIRQFADSNTYVSTLSRGNQNEIRLGDASIQVRNLNMDEWRTIDREDLRFAFRILYENRELTLDDVEPELAGRKSMVVAILATALDLEYDPRPLTVYR